jgi:hypothetical protein
MGAGMITVISEGLNVDTSVLALNLYSLLLTRPTLRRSTKWGRPYAVMIRVKPARAVVVGVLERELGPSHRQCAIELDLEWSSNTTAAAKGPDQPRQDAGQVARGLQPPVLGCAACLEDGTGLRESRLKAFGKEYSSSPSAAGKKIFTHFEAGLKV